MPRNGKVIIAMSGGVDSSVAACLLREQGYECVGVFMWVGGGVGSAGSETQGWPVASAGGDTNDISRSNLPRVKQGCCSSGDSCDAQAVTRRLGIPFYSLNFHADFNHIIEYFVDEYAHGRTPNPCVVCNSWLKFGKLLHYADLVDAEFVATGHYARVLDRDGQSFLARSRNPDKDQSYALFGIARENLPRCLFPLGEIEDKAEVRRIAADLGLEVHDKPESQEICFVPHNDYKTLVRTRRPETERPGEVRDARGRLLGTHAGIVNYTIGQRRGLGIAAGQPIYVTKLDAEHNTVVVGPREELMSAGLVADQVNWLTDPPADGVWQPAEIKIRSQHTPTNGRLRVNVAAGPRTGRHRLEAGATENVAAGPRASRHRLEAGPTVDVRFDEPQPAVTPGQATVFYRDDGIVLGGGWIVRGMQNG